MMKRESSVHALLVLPVVALTLIASGMLISSPGERPSPLTIGGRPQIVDPFSDIPVEKIERIHVGMTYKQVDSIIGEHLIAAKESTGTLKILYGNWVVNFVGRDGQWIATSVISSPLIR
jgi:hypothetical protein